VYHAQKGDINVVVPGDQTVSDMMLKHVAGIPIESQQQGGSRYGEGKLDAPEGKQFFWASGVQPAQAFQNKVTRLATLTGEDPRIIAHHLAMGNDSNNFAMHLVDANLKAIHGKGVLPENMEEFNRSVRAGAKGIGPFPHFPGVSAIIAGQNKHEIKDTLEFVHGTPLVWATIALVALHVVGAIKHQFDGNPVLYRMIPFFKRH
jgi:hypothetical protein